MLQAHKRLRLNVMWPFLYVQYTILRNALHLVSLMYHPSYLVTLKKRVAGTRRSKRLSMAHVAHKQLMQGYKG